MIDTPQAAILVGSLIIANLGTIITVFISALKLAAKFGEMTTKIEKAIADVNAAHTKIRDLDQKIDNYTLSKR